MIVKSFRASSAVRALKKVREEMGQEAIVLKTRQIRLKTGGTAVEITACIEKPTVGVASQVLAGTRSAAMATDEAVAVATEKVQAPPTRNRVQEYVPERVVTDREEAARLLGDDLVDQDEPTQKQDAPVAVKQKAAPSAPKQAESVAAQATKASDRASKVKQAAARVASALKTKQPAEQVQPQAKQATAKAEEKTSEPKATQEQQTAVAEQPKPDVAQPQAEKQPAAPADETAPESEQGTAEAPEEAKTKQTQSRKDVDEVDHHTIASAISAKLMESMTERIAGLEKRLESLQKSPAGAVKPRTGRLAEIDEVADRLLTADVPAEFVGSFSRELTSATEEDDADVPAIAQKLLTARVAEMMVPHFDFVAGDRLVFVGPAGAGKSSVMGKLAFRLAIKEKMKVKLSTLDCQKMAAHEEIASYADVLGVPLEDAPSTTGGNGYRRSGSMDPDSGDPGDEAKSDTSEKEPVWFIDAPALPSDDEAFRELCKRVRAVRPTNCFAVFSSLTRSADIVAMSEKLKELSPSHTILTMLDLTSCRGGVIAAARALETKVAFVCNAPAGRGHVLTPDPAAVTRMLLNTGVDLG